MKGNWPLTCHVQDMLDLTRSCRRTSLHAGFSSLSTPKGLLTYEFHSPFSMPGHFHKRRAGSDIDPSHIHTGVRFLFRTCFVMIEFSTSRSVSLCRHNAKQQVRLLHERCAPRSHANTQKSPIAPSQSGRKGVGLRGPHCSLLVLIVEATSDMQRGEPRIR